MSTLNPIILGKKYKTIISLNGNDVTTKESTISHMVMYIFDYLNELNDLSNIDLNTSEVTLLSSSANYIRNNNNIINFRISSNVNFPNNNLYNKFQNCSLLEKVIFDCNVPDLRENWGNLFYGCPNMLLLDLSKCTQVTRSSYIAVNNENFKIVVPDELYETWISTSPWSDVAPYIIKHSDYYN